MSQLKSNIPYLTRISTIILGILYLISAVFKAADINGFADILLNYQLKGFYFFSAFLTSIEILIAFSFLLNWQLRFISLLSLYFVGLLTLVLLYGVVFLNLNECGCYGSFFNIPIWLSIVRNFIMFFLSFFVYKKYSLSKKVHETTRLLIISFLTFLTFGLCLYELYTTYRVPSISVGDQIIQVKSKTHKQNTKIFVFSPLCHHCQKKVEHINKLLEENSEMEVIGMYDKMYKEKEIAQFKQDFKPSFNLIPISSDSMYHLTRKYPFYLNLKGTQIISVSNEL